jgi:hypothetical protein
VCLTLKPLLGHLNSREGGQVLTDNSSLHRTGPCTQRLGLRACVTLGCLSAHLSCPV